MIVNKVDVVQPRLIRLLPVARVLWIQNLTSKSPQKADPAGGAHSVFSQATTEYVEDTAPWQVEYLLIDEKPRSKIQART